MTNLEQKPYAGTRLVRYCGDILHIELQVTGDAVSDGLAFVRTNLGGAAQQRRAAINAVECTNAEADASGGEWRDIAMVSQGNGLFSCVLPLTETGVFEAKCLFLLAEDALPQWVPGDNLVIKVEPARTVAENTIYNAFVRQFGRYRSSVGRGEEQVRAEQLLDGNEYTVVPPSGRFRDLRRELPFIMEAMGFRFIQLLPIQPPPITYARMGRYGSPFAPTDYYSVDSSLAEFDRKATPMDQFRELVDCIHAHGGALLLDLPIDHTGWGATLQVHHPEWFCRNDDGSFANPGAWGVTWEDLCKLDFSHRELWVYLADVFLHWTALGVDGFRCDAGYMVPKPVWQYITAKVREQYPDAIFFLEGLGGSPEVTSDLLRNGGMNWAYSEIFQQLGADNIKGYLAHCFAVSESNGLAVNYAETHDNARLAERSATWAAMRTTLAALSAPRGAFGIANGVEWLATEKIDVHGASSLNWGAKKNLIEHITRLNDILRLHPAFGSGCQCRIVGAGTAVGILRMAADCLDNVLAVLNVEEHEGAWFEWSDDDFSIEKGCVINLLAPDVLPCLTKTEHGRWHLELAAGEAVCLARHCLDYYGTKRLNSIELQSLREMVLSAVVAVRGCSDISDMDVEAMTRMLSTNACAFLRDLFEKDYLPIVEWVPGRDERRVVPVPPNHFLLVHSQTRFRLCLMEGHRCLACRLSVPQDDGGQCILLPPLDLEDFEQPRDVIVRIEEFAHEKAIIHTGNVLLLPKASKCVLSLGLSLDGSESTMTRDTRGLCSNRRGSYALARARWGELDSKYDALLAASLDENCPGERIVALSRFRAWVVHHGFIAELAPDCQTRFEANYENCLRWTFEPKVTCGRIGKITATFHLDNETNCGTMVFHRQHGTDRFKALEDSDEFTLIVRPEVDWRVNHETTSAHCGAETEFRNCMTAGECGFRFAPWGVSGLLMEASDGSFMVESEWIYRHRLQEDAERALPSETDLFSPGYFKVEMHGGDSFELSFGIGSISLNQKNLMNIDLPAELPLGECLKAAMECYVANRDDGKTIIAGFPWFLDWGRDTLICLRGLIAAGRHQVVRDIIRSFASFEQEGTIPNMIRGNDSGDRATSDAPLWLFVAVLELMKELGEKGTDLLVMDCNGRTLLEIMSSIVGHYHSSLPNGILCDQDSGLVYSPSHFTWMDTNYPAGTPRQGYPVEIQVLWIHALGVMARLTAKKTYGEWQRKAIRSFQRFFIRKDGHGLCDCLHGDAGQTAENSVPDDAIRPNQLLAVTLCDFLPHDIAVSILDACNSLMIPGGNRSLDDADVIVEQPVWGDGRLLNNPSHPYIGRYEGDEDTRRKPAYHNGTAWGWTMPMFCEAMLKVYGDSARDAARCLLETVAIPMQKGCLGHIPEIYDGDAPHRGRGCPAQAWSVSEAFRVWKLLNDTQIPNEGKITKIQ